MSSKMQFQVFYGDYNVLYAAAAAGANSLCAQVNLPTWQHAVMGSAQTPDLALASISGS